MSEVSKADDALLARTANTVFGRKGELKSLAMMPHPRRVFAMIYSAQGTIDNGGFQYFFECDWPGRPPYTTFSDAYREIGATDVANWLDEAAAMFPFAEPHVHRSERVGYLREFCVKGDSPMGILSGEAIDASARVFTRLAEYVRLNSEHFKRS